MDLEERVAPWVVGMVVMAGAVWAAIALPVQAAFILTVAAVLAYGAWLATTYRRPVESPHAVAMYLVAVAFQIIHLSEEYTQGFPHEFVDLFESDRDWTEKSFLLTFVFGFGVIWVLAAAGALYRSRIANYMLWFYALGAGLVNAVSHFVFPILEGGYFPGLYTAVGHLVLSILTVRVLVRESNVQRARSRAAAGTGPHSVASRDPQTTAGR